MVMNIIMIVKRVMMRIRIDDDEDNNDCEEDNDENKD